MPQKTQEKKAESGNKSSPPGPLKVDGSPDLRYKENERPGMAIYDSRHRRGEVPKHRTDRPMGEEGDLVNADGTLDMRFLENRIKAGLVADASAERAQAAIDEPDVEPHRRLGKVGHTHRAKTARAKTGDVNEGDDGEDEGTE